MSKKHMDTELFDRAVVFAVNAHKGIERKGHNTPYVLHVFEAASICETMTSDIELLVSAVLHDTVEDTDTTIEDIEREFGKRVAYFVANETEPCVKDKTQAESWMERKQSIVNRLKNAEIETKMVALGDKLSNIRAIYRDYMKRGNELWTIFNNSNPKEIKWYYTSLKEVFSDLKDFEAYKEFGSLVDKVFENI